MWRAGAAAGETENLPRLIAQADDDQRRSYYYYYFLTLGRYVPEGV